jgi:hypothetical protein
MTYTGHGAHWSERCSRRISKTSVEPMTPADTKHRNMSTPKRSLDRRHKMSSAVPHHPVRATIPMNAAAQTAAVYGLPSCNSSAVRAAWPKRRSSQRGSQRKYIHSSTTAKHTARARLTCNTRGGTSRRSSGSDLGGAIAGFATESSTIERLAQTNDEVVLARQTGGGAESSTNPR